MRMGKVLNVSGKKVLREKNGFRPGEGKDRM